MKWMVIGLYLWFLPGCANYTYPPENRDEWVDHEYREDDVWCDIRYDPSQKTLFGALDVIIGAGTIASAGPEEGGLIALGVVTVGLGMYFIFYDDSRELDCVEFYNFKLIEGYKL